MKSVDNNTSKKTTLTTQATPEWNKHSWSYATLFGKPKRLYRFLYWEPEDSPYSEYINSKLSLVEQKYTISYNKHYQSILEIINNPFQSKDILCNYKLLELISKNIRTLYLFRKLSRSIISHLQKKDRMSSSPTIYQAYNQECLLFLPFRTDDPDCIRVYDTQRKGYWQFRRKEIQQFIKRHLYNLEEFSYKSVLLPIKNPYNNEIFTKYQLHMIYSQIPSQYYTKLMRHFWESGFSLAQFERRHRIELVSRSCRHYMTSLTESDVRDYIQEIIQQIHNTTSTQEFKLCITCFLQTDISLLNAIFKPSMIMYFKMVNSFCPELNNYPRLIQLLRDVKIHQPLIFASHFIHIRHTPIIPNLPKNRETVYSNEYFEFLNGVEDNSTIQSYEELLDSIDYDDFEEDTYDSLMGDSEDE